MGSTTTERTYTAERTLAEDLRLAAKWAAEVQRDLVASPDDLELLAQEELLAVMLERLERRRLYGEDA